MYKVKINYWGTSLLEDKIFETEMPKIPSQNEYIGFWDDPDWVIALPVSGKQAAAQ